MGFTARLFAIIGTGEPPGGSSGSAMAVFWPAGIGKAESYVLFDDTSPAWAGNSDLDVNPTDGTITKKKATTPVYRASIKGANYAA